MLVWEMYLATGDTGRTGLPVVWGRWRILLHAGNAFSLRKSQVLAKMSTCKFTLSEALVNNIAANCV